MPVLEVKARRVGGATYQVPMEVRHDRRLALGLRWLVNYTRNRGEKTMRDKLAGEILDALNNTGASIKKKEENKLGIPTAIPVKMSLLDILSLLLVVIVRLIKKAVKNTKNRKTSLY